jgi:hypothetical protein
MTLSVRATERERARDKRADGRKKGLGHVDASPPELLAGSSGGLVVAMLTRHGAYMQRRHAIPGNMYFCTSQAKFCWEGTDRGVHGYRRRRATRETAAIVFLGHRLFRLARVTDDGAMREKSCKIAICHETPPAKKVHWYLSPWI